MATQPNRRRFLQAATTTSAAFGLGDWTGLLQISPATADEATVTPGLVRFTPDIEPVVRLIEETPRDKCVPAILERLRQGLPYRQFLAAQYLAAIRAARFHAGQIHGYSHNAFVVHSVHQLSLDLPVSERLLPSFFNVDNFKGMQQGYPNRRGTPQLTGTLPSPQKAEDELHTAMRDWDAERGERAIVAMARALGAPLVFEPLWRYAGRDWRFIGHNAILVANSCRLLETIGWQHAEPLLRYVVQGLAAWGDNEGPQTQPYPANLERVEKNVHRLPENWAVHDPNEVFTCELLATLRKGDGEAACELALRELIDGKTQAGAVWDAVHLAAGQLHLGARWSGGHQWNGGALHAVTSSNALHYAFRASAKDENRLLLLLQSLAWVAMFLRLLRKHDELDESQDITRLAGAELPEGETAAVEEILTRRTTEPLAAAGLAFALANRPGGATQLVQEARRAVARKASDVHDVKFPVALFENLDLVSARWRPHLLGAGVYSFQGSGRPDNPVIQQAREAVEKV